MPTLRLYILISRSVSHCTLPSACSDVPSDGFGSCKALTFSVQSTSLLWSLARFSGFCGSAWLCHFRQSCPSLVSVTATSVASRSLATRLPQSPSPFATRTARARRSSRWTKKGQKNRKTDPRCGALNEFGSFYEGGHRYQMPGQTRHPDPQFMFPLHRADSDRYPWFKKRHSSRSLFSVKATENRTCEDYRTESKDQVKPGQTDLR